jgi:hypothetical protein
MALSVGSKEGASPEKATSGQAKTETVKVELALYNRYNRRGTHFEKGVVYKMSTRQALELLSETDHGRQIFKLHASAKSVQKPKNKNLDETGAVDLSAKDLNKPTVDTPDGDNKTKENRIDIGDESEILEVVQQIEKAAESADDAEV